MKAIVCACLVLLMAACARVKESAPADTVRHRFAQPPERAGACFARNAEAHSAALVAEVGAPDASGHVHVIVRVRNGVTYATADLRPAGGRAEGTITLMAISTRGSKALVQELVEGC